MGFRFHRRHRSGVQDTSSGAGQLGCNLILSSCLCTQPNLYFRSFAGIAHFALISCDAFKHIHHLIRIIYHLMSAHTSPAPNADPHPHTQLASGWFAAILFSITISFASITPKVVSGYSLKDLLAAATTDKMKGEGAQQVSRLHAFSHKS